MIYVLIHKIKSKFRKYSFLKIYTYTNKYYNESKIFIIFVKTDITALLF